MSWGINPNAKEKEKIFANFADYIQGMNSVCEIDYSAYSQIWDMGRALADKEYQQGKLDAVEECIKIVKLVGADEHSYNEMLCEMEKLKEQKD